MPVHRKTKDTTSTPDPSTPDPSSLVVPEQHVFHQYLRGLAQSAVRIVLETVMREELEQFIGAAWGESSPKRKGYRNGHYTRDLVTSTGRIDDINVPRDRSGQFHTQAFERYRRYEPHIARSDATGMFVAGVSTHKVGEVAETLLGVARSRQYDQSPQLGCSPTNMRRGGSVRGLRIGVSSTQDAGAFQHSSWEEGRFHHHFNGG